MGLMQKISHFFTFDDETTDDELIVQDEKPRWKGKLISLTSSKHNAIVIMEPGTMKEAQDVGNHLKNRASVVLNLQALDREMATRILDFTSGMAYALSGTMEKISDGIFLFAPSTIMVLPPPRKVGVNETGQLFIK